MILDCDLPLKLQKTKNSKNKSSKLGNYYTKNCGLNAKFKNFIFKDNPTVHCGCIEADAPQSEPSNRQRVGSTKGIKGRELPNKNLARKSSCQPSRYPPALLLHSHQLFHNLHNVFEQFRVILWWLHPFASFLPCVIH